MSERERLLAALRARMRRFIETSDPDAIFSRQAVDEVTALLGKVEGPHDVDALREAGWFYWFRFQMRSDREDLEMATGVLASVFEVSPEDVPPELVPSLAFAYPQAARPAARSPRRTTAGPPQGDLERSNQKAVGLLEQALRSEAVEVLDQAVALLQKVVARTPGNHRHRAGFLSNLTAGLHLRYLRTGNLEDLEAAVAAGREAVAAAPNDVGFGARLGLALQSRYEARGDPADLAEAIDAHRRAAEAMPPGHPHLAGHRCNLSSALLLQYERQTGDLADLEAAVDLARDAARAPGSAPADSAIFFANLCKVLLARYHLTRELEDLEDAVTAGRRAEAIEPRPAGLHSDLELALLARYRRDRKPNDLAQAIESCRQTLASIPQGDPNRANCLANLGRALQTQHLRTGDLTTLRQAIHAFAEAITTIPVDHPDSVSFMLQGGAAVYQEYLATKDQARLEWAIENLRLATRSTPRDHPDRAARLFILGHALRTRFDLTGYKGDLVDAIGSFTTAAHLTAADPGIRISASRVAATLSARVQDWGKATEQYRAAIELLSSVVADRPQRLDQEHWLRQFPMLAADAAACTLSAGEPRCAEHAVELLEFGRGILLSQALGLRNDLVRLRREAPKLAMEFGRLQEQVIASQQEELDTLDDHGLMAGSVRVNPQRQQLRAEFDAVVSRIRRRRGFKRFLLPPPISELTSQAVDGPIVFVSASHYRCDALIVQTDGVRVVPLPRLTVEAVAERVLEFGRAVDAVDLPRVRWLARRRARQVIDATLSWLWETTAAPVLEALGFDGPPVAGQAWPRLWWAPTSLFSYLPLHAAGSHNLQHGQTDGHTVMGRVVSSYTPTVQALRHARSARRTPPSDRSTLVVAVPHTRGWPSLAGATREAAFLRDRFPAAKMLVGRQATRDRVLAELPAHAIAHFACHALSEYDYPSDSRLLLDDHEQRPLTVRDLVRIARTNAERAHELAYLSACHTSHTANPLLVDESAHLTTTFQLIGYRHVIGTLWAIDDGIAADLTQRVYLGLAGHDGIPIDGDRAAVALHQATRELRARHPRAPWIWAAHVHIGA